VAQPTAALGSLALAGIYTGENETCSDAGGDGFAFGPRRAAPCRLLQQCSLGNRCCANGLAVRPIELCPPAAARTCGRWLATVDARTPARCGCAFR
jgi:hypothetical protein